MDRFTFFIGLLFCVSGCGLPYPTVNLSGEVSVDGVAVDEGFISITPTVGGNGTGMRVPVLSGRYYAKNVPLGQVRFSLDASRKTGKQIEVMGVMMDEVVQLIPEKYANGQVHEITKGQTVLDFKL